MPGKEGQMRIKRKIIQIDEERCDGCGLCIPGCAEGALQIVAGKARIVAERFCDGLGACLGECPNDALKVIEREADEFDETAVEEHLARQRPAPAPTAGQSAGRCPSAGIQMLAPSRDCREANAPRELAREQAAPSALGHWPIKIRLVPPEAPFLRGAELLVLADCGAAAYPALHGELLRDRVVLMGCPKFDDAASHVEKFAAIFRQAGIRKVVCAYMEVPCCAALPRIVLQGMQAAGVDVPVEHVVIGVRGRLLPAAPPPQRQPGARMTGGA
jgi:Pyruvate/2-oxoacid:ferredoxin oxidoreductase delta subunit